ncbi:Uncharacterised protein [Serratia proteamaculans]|jgi:hypothetical protein|nr:Uncharacterised protein [Serratia proteamaculans]
MPDPFITALLSFQRHLHQAQNALYALLYIVHIHGFQQ